MQEYPSDIYKAAGNLVTLIQRTQFDRTGQQFDKKQLDKYIKTLVEAVS